MNRLPPTPRPPSGPICPLLVAQAVAVYRLAADLARTQPAPRRAAAFSRN